MDWYNFLFVMSKTDWIIVIFVAATSYLGGVFARVLIEKSKKKRQGDKQP